MDEKGEVLYEIKPKFDFIYELFMPTGKKMRSGLVGCFIALILNIILRLSKDTLLSVQLPNLDSIYNICVILCALFFICSIIFFIARVIFQILEYRGISYKFYKDCVIYENNFLNQTRKTIEYSNIREVEIRRSVLDRILNFGVIIIFTNADKAYGSATVIYAVKNTKEQYDNIEKIIHSGNMESSPITDQSN